MPNYRKLCELLEEKDEAGNSKNAQLRKWNQFFSYQRAIRHLIEVTWVRGDIDVLDKYFGNTVSASRGKPTNGEFIARIANVVKQRLRDAA